MLSATRSCRDSPYLVLATVRSATRFCSALNSLSLSLLCSVRQPLSSSLPPPPPCTAPCPPAACTMRSRFLCSSQPAWTTTSRPTSWWCVLLCAASARLRASLRAAGRAAAIRSLAARLLPHRRPCGAARPAAASEIGTAARAAPLRRLRAVRLRFASAARPRPPHGSALAR